MGVLQLSCKRFQENPKTCATAFPDVRPSAAARLEGSSVKVLAAAAIGLVVGVLVSPSAARAEVPTQPQVTFPQQPVPSPSDALDPRAQVQELQRQISELHDSWDSLTPEQRNAHLKRLQRQATTVDQGIHNLPPEEQPEVEAMLLSSTLQLFDLLRIAQASQR
jgi:hypothetical protein